jgi:hypothetical protein
MTDLRAQDFEIIEDGKARTITNFSYLPRALAQLGNPRI